MNHLVKRIAAISTIVACLTPAAVIAQSIHVQLTSANKRQVIDGFGTTLYGATPQQEWFQELYFTDAECSILRIDITPVYTSPYSDLLHYSPWYHNNPSLPGPEGTNVRSYVDASSYMKAFNGMTAPIAVMGTNIDDNVKAFNYDAEGPKSAGIVALRGSNLKKQLGDFKLMGSMWSPAPWLKVPSGKTHPGNADPLPRQGAKYPFIWAANFVGGKLDVSETPNALFNDGTENTSALTQFARTTAAYIYGFQKKYGVAFYAISIQNELNFETFYNSCTYPLTDQYIKAIKYVRAEFDKYAELRDIKIIGPEDLLGSDAYGLWEYGRPNRAVDPVVHKNLKYVNLIEIDPVASDVVDFYCIHGYSGTDISPTGSESPGWSWWVNGWQQSPAQGLPDVAKGILDYKKTSWMTETSGESHDWLNGTSTNSAFWISLKIHHALTTGMESAWLYWQLVGGGDGELTAEEALTNGSERATAPKYIAFKHYSKYIRPGSVRYESAIGQTDVHSSSYVDTTTNRLTTVLVNASTNPSDAYVIYSTDDSRIVLPGSLLSITSSSSALWQMDTLQSITGAPLPSFSVTVPARGVVTLVSLDEESSVHAIDESIRVFPNPSTGIVRIMDTAGFNTIEMFDVRGQVVFSSSLPQLVSDHTVDASNLACGNYRLRISNGNARVSEHTINIVQ